MPLPIEAKESDEQFTIFILPNKFGQKTPESVTLQSKHLRQTSHHAPPPSENQNKKTGEKLGLLTLAPNQHQLK